MNYTCVFDISTVLYIVLIDGDVTRKRAMFHLGDEQCYYPPNRCQFRYCTYFKCFTDVGLFITADVR